MTEQILKEEIKLQTVEEALVFVVDEKGVKDIEKRISELQKKLKSAIRLIERISPEYVSLMYQADSDKLSKVKAQLDEQMTLKNKIETDIRTIIKFKDQFKKKLAGKGKIIEQQKIEKLEQEYRLKFMEELSKNIETVADIFIDGKRKDKSLTFSKFISKIKRSMKNENDKKDD